MELKYPILFIPGTLLPNRWVTHSYFKGLQKRDNSNLEYYIPPLPTWSSAEQRSFLIEDFIEKNIGEKPFHVIAHSKGGIDMRYLINTSNLEEQIISFTAISCPFQGSSLASLLYKYFQFLRVIPGIKNIIYIFKELTPQHIARLIPNDKLTQSKKFYVSSSIKGNKFLHTYPLFWLTHPYIHKHEGENDGLVSTSSASFGKKLFESTGDHTGLIGHFFTKKREKRSLELINNIIDHLKKTEATNA